MSSVSVEERTLKSGRVTCRVVVRRGGRGGRRKVVASNLGKGEAEKLRRDLEKQLNRAGAGLVDITPTVGAVLDAYMETLKTKPSGRTAPSYVKHIDRLRSLELGLLARARLVSWVAELADEGVPPPSIKKAVDILKAAINRARDRGEVVLGDNPAARLKSPRQPRRTKQTLEPREAMVLLPHFADDYRPLFALALFTGLRPGELGALRPSDLAGDLVNVSRTVTRNIPKDGDERTVPLLPEAMAWWRLAVEQGSGGELFSARVRRSVRDGDLGVVFRRAMRRAVQAGDAPSLCTGWVLRCRRQGCGHWVVVDAGAEVQDARCAAVHPKQDGICGFRLWPTPTVRQVRWYDLRATCATLLYERGVPLNVVAAILGHSDVVVTKQNYIDASAAVRRLTLEEPKKRRRA
jgi:integrase